MFVPVHDDNHLRSIKWPVVTWALIAINCVVFAFQAAGMPLKTAVSFAIIPVELFKVGVVGGPAFGPNDGLPVAEHYTLVAYQFLHGDVLHLAGNMLFLWVFGDNVEDAMGHARFLGFYLLCGVAGGLMHALMLPASDAPLIGASAAVAGVIAAYLLIYPHVRVWVLVARFIPLRITAAFALGVWIATQGVMAVVPYFSPRLDMGPVAWWAHVGGILAGGLLVVVLRRPGVPLWGGGQPS